MFNSIVIWVEYVVLEQKENHIKIILCLNYFYFFGLFVEM